MRRIAPVAGSTVLSMKLSVPVSGADPPVGSVMRATSGASAWCWRMSGRWRPGRVQAACTGAIWWMVTSSVSSLARTRLPASTRTSPVRPVRGERIVAKPSSRRAASTAAWPALTAALKVATRVAAWSACSADTNPLAAAVV